MDGPRAEALQRDLLDVWRSALKNDGLTAEDDFFESGGDSVLAAQVASKIEQMVGKPLPAAILFETGTVRLLAERLTEKGAFSPRVGFLTGSGDGGMVHYFHADFWQGGAYTRDFSRMLGRAHRVHAMAPHLPHEVRMPGSIEEMAEDRLRLILQAQADGPYALIGYCMGALVAFETARRLVSMGKDVKALVMIDPTIMSARRSARIVLWTAGIAMRAIGLWEASRRKGLIWMWRKMIGAERVLKDLWRLDVFLFRKTWAEKRAVLGGVFGSFGKYREEVAAPDRWEVMRHYYSVMFDYRPKPLDIPLLYVSLEYSGKAWRRIAKGSEFLNIYRGRHDFWEDENAQSVVDRILGHIGR